MVAIIVEDGTGPANANSYVTVAEANAYFAAVGNSVWDGLDDADQKGPFLVLAVRFMQQTYRTRWQGYRGTVTQKLDWPRWNVNQFDVAGGYGPFPRYYLPTQIPQEIKDAQCELAVRVANGDLNADIERLETSVQVGSIKLAYDNSKPANTVFTAVELLLRPFFMQGSGVNAKVRR